MSNNIQAQIHDGDPDNNIVVVDVTCNHTPDDAPIGDFGVSTETRRYQLDLTPRDDGLVIHVYKGNRQIELRISHDGLLKEFSS